MKIKTYHIYLVSMVAIGLICLPILGSASYWEYFDPHSNTAQHDFTGSRWGRSIATLEVRELWSGTTYLGIDEIVDYSGDAYDNSGWIITDIRTIETGRMLDNYIFCKQECKFNYWLPHPDVKRLVGATTYWNDNTHSFINIDEDDPW